MSRKPTTRRGELKDKITVKSVTLSDDGQGGSTETLTTTASMWSKVEPLTGSRALEFQQITGSQGYTITFSYRGDIDISTKSVIEYNSETLSIHSVRMIDENRKQFKILAYNKT